MDNFTKSQTRFRTLHSWTGFSGIDASGLGYFETQGQSSVRTPGYRFLKKYQLPMNPYSQNYNKFESQPGSVSLLSWNGSQYVTNTWTGWMGSIGLDKRLHNGMATNSPYATCVNKALGKLSVSNGSALVTLAEAGKTASLISTTVTKITRAYSSLKRGRLRQFLLILGITKVSRNREIRFYRGWRKAFRENNLRDFVFQTWLEFKYGWMPLYSDIHSQAKNLAEYMTERSTSAVRRVVATHQTEKKGRRVDKSSVYWHIHSDEFDSKQGRLVINYKFGSPPSAANVFGLTNPLLVAYELLPFSFVYDWFQPIGKYLESLTATNGLTFHSGTYTEKGKAVITNDLRVGTPTGSGPSLIVCSSVSGVSYEIATYKNRGLLGNFPSPEVPDFRQPEGFAKFFTSLALLNNVVSSRR